MKEADIKQAYVRMREVDQTIPDEVLDFMRDAAIEKLHQLEEAARIERETFKCGNGPHAPFGFVRLKCEYDNTNTCIHCGEGIPY